MHIWPVRDASQPVLIAERMPGLRPNRQRYDS
jgi:hypothetical protein